MKQRTYGLIGYSFLFTMLVILDQLTKVWALCFLIIPYHTKVWLPKVIAPLELALEVVINRGISWGMLHSENEANFWLLTLLIIGIVIFLAHHAYMRWKQVHLIIGEVMVLAGAVSNIIDRVHYRGVIDFIMLTWRDVSWPTFNLADSMIVVGVGIMLIVVYQQREQE
jgi:signal peptidase II